MHPLDDLKSYIGFTDEDSRRLAALKPHAEPHVEGIVESFYDTIKAHERARAVLQDDAQVERLKGTLARWLRELLAGPHDYGYYEQRLNIGRVHVRVRLPQQYMFTAMSLIRRDLEKVARDALDAKAADAARESIGRICDIELAIMVGTFMEEHEKQELKELGSLLFANLPLAAFLVDHDGNIGSHSPSRERVLLRHVRPGLALADALDPAFLAATDLERHLERARQTSREIVLPRVDIPLQSGMRVYRVTVLPLEHRVASAFVAAEDLSESVAVEARIQHARYLSKLGTMAASVAHELRNPLAGFSSTMQVIASSLPPEDRRRAVLDKVQDQIKRLDLLVADLLSFARPLNAQRARFDLALAARQTRADVSAAGLGTPDVQGQGSAVGDRLLLAQVLLNLVQNAYQAGAERVLIRVRDGVVDVIDDGPGVGDEVRPRLFEPFFTTKTRGTGLGLSVARKSVEAMGGALELAEEPSELGGARFEITLPVVE